MKIRVYFYSYRPRLSIDFFWETNIPLNIGDKITVPNRLITQWDKKFFSSKNHGYDLDFVIRDKCIKINRNYDLHVELFWTKKLAEDVKIYKIKNNIR